MDYANLLGMAEGMGLAVSERALPDGLCGAYYAPRRLILIDEALGWRQKRCTLCHEIVHAAHGDKGCDAKTERRTRTETALRLIDPAEYALAERMHEGGAWQMACELGVTMQVLEDYRRLLHDGVVTPGRA